MYRIVYRSNVRELIAKEEDTNGTIERRKNRTNKFYKCVKC